MQQVTAVDEGAPMEKEKLLREVSTESAGTPRDMFEGASEVSEESNEAAAKGMLPDGGEHGWESPPSQKRELAMVDSTDLEEHQHFDDVSALLESSNLPPGHTDEMGASRASQYDHNEHCPQPPRYCTGCSTVRLLMAPMAGLVVTLIGLTYYAYVFETEDASIIELAFFHILIGFLIASYLQCMLLDPGTVPDRWHYAISVSPERVHYKVCRHCSLYKPPRAHFDSITQRLVLNMDHFCPWMVNCVGFYNRKFFILFLLWTTLSCMYFLTAMLIRVGGNVQMLLLNSTGRPTVVKFMAFVVDAALGIAVAGFLSFHLKLVIYNQTTIESEVTEFDVGWRRNVNSVLGSNPWLWLVPVYGGGPVGDGIHWPRRARAGPAADAAAKDLEMAAAGPDASSYDSD